MLPAGNDSDTDRAGKRVGQWVGAKVRRICDLLLGQHEQVEQRLAVHIRGRVLGQLEARL